MSVQEMQQRIIDQIRKIEAPELLELETEQTGVYELSEERKAIIMEAQAEYKAGKFITQEELDKEIDELLNEPIEQ